MISSKEQFLSKCKPSANGCLEWQDHENTRPSIIWRGKQQLVHRVAHILFIGPIPEGLRIIRTCQNNFCVLPQHLQIAKSDPFRWNRLSLTERLKQGSTVDSKSGCINWNGRLNAGGYGALCYKSKKNLLVHRLSYTNHYGTFPSELDVLHKCDNPSCINPEHLFLGTDKDNRADCCAKERQSRGEGRPNHKLTEKEILEIRDLYASKHFSTLKLGKLYSVNSKHIHNIVTRKKWKHVT